MVELVNIDGFTHHIHHTCTELLSFIGSNLNIHERSCRVRIHIDFSFIKLVNAVTMAVVFKFKTRTLEHIVRGKADDESGRGFAGYVIERGIKSIHSSRYIVHIVMGNQFFRVCTGCFLIVNVHKIALFQVKFVEHIDYLVSVFQIQGIFADIGSAVSIITCGVVGFVCQDKVLVLIGFVVTGGFTVAFHGIVKNKAVVRFRIGSGGEDHQHAVGIDSDGGGKGLAFIVAMFAVRDVA